MLNSLRNTTTAAFIFGLTAVMTLSSCATHKTAKPQDQIAIEKVESASVNITHAYLLQTDEGYTLRGELKRRHHSHALIPGHLHVELIDPDGRELQTADIDYKRKGTKSHISTFHLPIPIALEPGSTIRISHFEPDAHGDGEQDAVWRQPDTAK